MLKMIKYCRMKWIVFFMVKMVVATSPLIFTSPRPSPQSEPLKHGSTVLVEQWNEIALNQRWVFDNQN